MRPRRSLSSNLIRVQFKVPAADSWVATIEKIWAARIGERRARVATIPMFANGVSRDDVIFVRPLDEGTFAFDGVSIRAGHSTFRVEFVFDATDEEIDSHWRRLEELGCKGDGDSRVARAIDVPPGCDIHEVLRLLEIGVAEDVWRYDTLDLRHALEAR